MTRALAFAMLIAGLVPEGVAFGGVEKSTHAKIQPLRPLGAPFHTTPGHRAFGTGGVVGESSAHPEVQRSRPLESPLQATPYSGPTSGPASTTSWQTQQQAESLGPNLIQNPSVETAGSPGLPAQWNKGGYGTNARTLTYPVPGFNSPSGLQTSISSYTSGDAKWYFNDVAVTPGATYEYSDHYVANAPTILTARFKLSSGTFTYKDLATLAPNGAYTKTVVRFVVPADVVSLTIFHLIKQVGDVQTDAFALQEVTPAGSTDPDNLVPNPGFETPGSGDLPLNWNKGRWGTNTTVFSYPVPGVQDSKAAKVAMTSYTSGDAKWYFDPVNMTRGSYTSSTAYKANRTSFLTVRFQHQDGTFTYQDIGIVPASSAFASVSAGFWVPMSVKNLTVFHLIKGIGELVTDNVGLRLTAAPNGIFTTGAVSLAFDDGWLSQYQQAVPKMNAAGVKATFFIVTQRMADHGFPGYMSKAQVTQLFNQGHEIGAHTRTHRALSKLSDSEQQNEINGSRQDLLAMNVGPIQAFAYPFGDYNSTTLQLVKDAGFTNARSTINGHVNPNTDEYQLPRFGMVQATTFGQAKQTIDQAIANKEWVILTFHQITDGTEQYTTSPALFDQIIDYLVQQRITVIPVSQGIPSMQ